MIIFIIKYYQLVHTQEVNMTESPIIAEETSFKKLKKIVN